ncbi:hypothetical protein SLEP1_g20451 [Rubroshorea leprosula]|uniref:Uncharacterized protein n=1 Tax=Rubroshorea leprosula TaxID=152421 RepID=A0AAV5JDE8_9ROSI|nr:hypothetical protein SLEP1_g20451 [Rubroshorea leprosula]
MRTEMKRHCLGFTSAVLLILLFGEVLEAASITGVSISTTNIAEFIGDEEFLMDSEINARFLVDKPNICKDIGHSTPDPNHPVSGCYAENRVSCRGRECGRKTAQLRWISSRTN